MSDLKNAILDAKYVDMISIADFVVRDNSLPEEDADGNPMPQATEIAASLFRWAVRERLPVAEEGAAPEAQDDSEMDGSSS